MKTKIFLLIGIICLFACNSAGTDAPVPDELETPEPVEGVTPDPDEEDFEEETPDPDDNGDDNGHLPDFGIIPRKDIELTSVEKQLSEQSNVFAFNLLKAVYADEGDDHANILLSPLSASLALSMLNSGATGKTGEEIRQMLGFGQVSSEEINGFAQKLISAMQTLDPRGAFESANAIWIQDGFPVLETYKQVNQQYYDAEIQNIDFSQPSTLQTVNNWFYDKTHGYIPEMLNEIDPSTCLLLGNALYFNGYWTYPFYKNLTADSDFRNPSGTYQTVPVMRQTRRTQSYTRLDNCAALELPFGNEAFSLVLVLPDENTDVSSIVGQADGDWWNQVITGLEGPPYYFEVEMAIPRFKLEYERSLTNDLKSLGMNVPFDSNAADFSLISNQGPLYVSGVKQKTFAQMDEEGIRVAAATMIVMDGSDLDEIEYVHVKFNVNRPFLYFIKEKSTRLVFFAGIMNKIN